jgi:quercetin dioxygenase-like cupin family protein
MAQDTFARDGYLGPVRVLTPRESRVLTRHLNDPRRPAPADWEKGRAVTDWLPYQLAASPRLLSSLTPLLGEDIVLWGCSLIWRRPGEVHPWHVDIESSAPDGRFVTAWIGLENTSGAALRLIAGSHTIKPLQQVQAERGFRRGAASTEEVLAWARDSNPQARLVEPEIADGEAILFDGRVWHGTDNTRAWGARSALILQFAAADTPVRIPDPAQVEWPFRFLAAPRPPTVLVHGQASGGANRLAPPPVPPIQEGASMLTSCIRSLDLPLAEDAATRWGYYPLFQGATPNLGEMESHVSVLSAGHMPHPPHAHDEEELLIILDGEADLLLADGPSAEGARAERVAPGSFAYYPAGQHHTLRNPGPSPVSYLMFKWRAGNAQAQQGATPTLRPLGATVFRYGDCFDARASAGFAARTIFEQPTSWLGRLHCHATRLEPGASYAPHADAHDIAIYTLSGRLETLGQEVGPHSVIYYAGGEVHGMRNIGDEPARYIVFEFQAPGVELPKPVWRRARTLAKRALKRLAGHLGVFKGSRHALRARIAHLR